MSWRDVLPACYSKLKGKCNASRPALHLQQIMQLGYSIKAALMVPATRNAPSCCDRCQLNDQVPSQASALYRSRGAFGSHLGQPCADAKLSTANL